MLSQGSAAPSYNEPNWFVPEKEKNTDWYLQATRFFSTFYSPSPVNYNSENPNENLNAVERGMQYALYYQGNQQNINYNHVVNGLGGDTLQPLWVKSKKVKNLVDRLAAQYIEQLFSKDISAKALSERAQNAKLKKWEDVMFKFDHRNDWINKQLQEVGIDYAPVGGKEFKDKEDAERWLTYTLKDDLELYATDLARAIEFMNDSDTTYIQSFVQDFCPSNYMGIYNYVEAGKIKQKRIPFYNLIYDYTSDDPFIRDGRFAGFVEYLPATKIIDDPNISLTKTERDEIIDLQKQGGNLGQFMSLYNGIGNIRYWDIRNNQLFVAKVTMFFIAPKDTGYNKGTDKYRNDILSKSINGKSGGEYIVNDLYKTVVVGNKYLVESGLEKNVVRPVGDKRNVALPVWVFNANNTLGEGVSIIGEIAQLIDKMDFYQTKITETVGRSKGKCYVFRGTKMDKNLKDMVTNFATMGMDVVIGTTGEGGDPANGQKIVEGVDMTLDPNVTAYITLHNDLERQIEEILNMPKIAQGAQSAVIGLGVQKNTTSLANQGMGYMWYNLLKFNTLAMNHATNMARIIIASGDHDMDFVVGVRGEKMMQCIKDTRFEDCLIDLSIKDSITESQRQTLLQWGLGWAQNDRLDPLDGIAMLKASTLTELENDFKYALEKREKKQEDQARATAQQQASLNAQDNQTELTKKNMEQQGQDSRTEATNKTALAKEILKRESKSQLAEQQ